MVIAWSTPDASLALSRHAGFETTFRHGPPPRRRCCRGALARALAPTELQLRSKSIASLHQSTAATLQRSSADADLAASLAR